MSSTTPQTTYHGSYLMPSLEHATVADAMHPGVMTCDPDATVTQVARMMASHHIHCLAVIGVSHEHRESLSWGIISDLDVLRAGVDPSDQTAATMATHPVVTVDPTTPLLEAARLMLTHNAPHVLVIDGRKQRPVGILSTLDIAGVLAWGEA
jgi:CBS domain-containing protein